MSYSKGDLVMNKERMHDSPAGTFAFYLGDQEYIFLERNYRFRTPYFLDFAKVEQTEKLVGKNFCITGALNHPREFYKKLVEINGGTWKSGVSSKVHYLIVSREFLDNEKWGQPSEKLSKARELGVKVITFNDFLKMIA